MDRLNRIQVSVSSKEDISISRRPAGGACTMRIRRGPKCFVLTGVAFCFFLLIYVQDMTNIIAYVNNKVPVHRHVVRWVENEHDHRRPRMMITYKGRLGNHMFEYATLIGIARRYNMTPIIPDDVDLLDVFKIPTPQGSLDLLRDPKRYPEEKAATYYKGVEKIDPTRDAYLDGYYQSWKYFDDLRDELLNKHFLLHPSLKIAANNYIKNLLKERKLEGAVLVAVHVRRGDFVRQRVKGYTAAPIPYYYKAMDHFRKKYGKVMFIICTNDLIWAETNLDEGPDVHYSHETDGSLDLAIMISCDHMIITSGSYSWWAGYLVKGEVIYYAGYPAPNTKIGNLTSKEDYYPPYWTGLMP
ncbi:galactoside 2-alpha-L-fucosyltransferase Sec1-like isoform X2 [Physella acuta]|uniref:galactoside 2-alpha-L-fucosyltransferase Sec1-like isoform X2 n=1 Tax=Physella acuta TaxID=109671 RepID=UPI0027DE5538|nr:galactoside 2-alpha-L-fucosyltransferase Sec1-like isoform X2 [Physella acuta]